MLRQTLAIASLFLVVASSQAQPHASNGRLLYAKTEPVGAVLHTSGMGVTAEDEHNPHGNVTGDLPTLEATREGIVETARKNFNHQASKPENDMKHFFKAFKASKVADSTDIGVMDLAFKASKQDRTKGKVDMSSAPSITPLPSATPAPSTLKSSKTSKRKGENDDMSLAPSITPFPSATPTPSSLRAPKGSKRKNKKSDVSPAPSITPSPSATPAPSSVKSSKASKIDRSKGKVDDMSYAPSITPFPSVTPAPSFTEKLSVTPAPTDDPTVLARGSISFPDFPNAASDANEDALSLYTLRMMTPFTVEYNTTGGPPDSDDYESLANVTEYFLNDAMARYFDDNNEIDYYETQIEMYIIRDEYLIEYHAKSLFAKTGGVPSLMELDRVVTEIFENKLDLGEYKALLEDLGADNVFSSTSAIVQDGYLTEPLIQPEASQESESTSPDQRKAFVAPVVGVLSVLSLLVVATMYTKRRRAHKAELSLYDKAAVANELKPQPGDEVVSLDGASNGQHTTSSYTSGASTTYYNNSKPRAPEPLLSSMTYESSLRQQEVRFLRFDETEDESSQDEEETEEMARMDDVSLSDAISVLEEESLNGSMV